MTGYGGPEGDDVVEQGDGRLRTLDRFRLPPWRPSRGAAILGAAGLIAGLAAGYSAGSLRPGHAGPARAAATAPAAPATATSGPVTGFTGAGTVAGPAIPVYGWIQQGTGTCAARNGRELQVGIEVSNQSGSAVTLRQVKPILPLGGLRVVSSAWGPCGSLPGSLGQAGEDIAPGASDWFTVTFRVLVKCPGPLPVQFVLLYQASGQAGAAQLPGFADLGQVPYPGCPGGPGAEAGAF